MEIKVEQEPPLLPQDKTENESMNDLDTKSEKKLGDFCVVCFSKVDRSKLPKQSSLLSNNLNVIFLLKNVLQVPSELLIDNFRKCGSPVFWISLCENCSKLNGQAMERHLQILTLVNQLRSILKTITDKIRQTSVPTEVLTSYQDNVIDKKKSMQEKRLQILKSTREFVNDYDYNTHLVNPFIEGDKRARELDEEEDSCSSGDSSEDEGSILHSSSEDNSGEEWGGGGWQDEDDYDNEGTQGSIFNKKLFPTRSYVNVDGKWKCQYCDTLLASKRLVRSHEQAVHPSLYVPGRLECDICGRKVNNLSYLERHLKKVHQVDMDGNHIEPDTSKRSLRKEYIQVDGKWKCRYCENLFRSKQTVGNHEREKHSLVPGKFTCEICGKKWNSRVGYKLHQKTHKFDNEGNLIKPKPMKPHLQVDGKWKCRYCDISFESKHMVYSHERRNHNSVKYEDKFVCDICGKVFNSRSYLLRHTRQGHEPKKAKMKLSIPKKYRKRNRKPAVKPKDPPTCHLCGKSFSSMYTLRCHLKYFHEKEFKKHCHVCGVGIRNSSSLKAHLLRKHQDDPVTKKMIEEGVNLWKCGVVGCLAVYLKEKSLEEHTKEVHGDGEGGGNPDKQFTCSFCGKLFWSRYRLMEHETLHKLGAERPYSCDVCGAKLKAKGTVRKHKRKFHPETLK